MWEWVELHLRYLEGWNRNPHPAMLLVALDG